MHFDREVDSSIPYWLMVVATFAIAFGACTFEHLDHTSVVTWEAALAYIDCWTN